MKKRKIYMALVALLLVVCMGYAVGKMAEKEEDTPAVELPEIPKEQAQEVKQIFQIELPEEGKVLYYQTSLHEDSLGYFYAEIEFSEEHYEELMAQVKEYYSVDTLGKTYNKEYMFETTAEEIDEIYMTVTGVRRKVELDKWPVSIYYWIYTTKLQDGTFRLLFVSSRC